MRDLLGRAFDGLRRLAIFLRPIVIELARRAWRLARRAARRVRERAPTVARTLLAGALLAAASSRAWLRAGGPRALARRLARVPLVRVPLAAVLLAALALGALVLGTTRVEPGRIGVRQIDWGPGSGIVPRDYASGLHYGVHARSTWHWLDGRTTFLRFAPPDEGPAQPPLEIRTLEGNTAQVAVTVPYRIRRGEAHRIVADGIKETYSSQARSVIRSVLLQELAAKRSQELYDTDTRLALAASALERVQPELARLHVEALGVHVSGVWFPPTYEKKLQESQLDSQDARTTQAQNALADAAWRAQLVEDEITRAEQELRAAAEAAIERERLASEAEITTVARAADEHAARGRAEADAEHLRLTAEGALALARAEAERERLANEARDSVGGRLMLARQAAENLRFRSITLDSRDPRVPSMLDLDELAGLLIGE